MTKPRTLGPYSLDLAYDLLVLLSKTNPHGEAHRLAAELHKSLTRHHHDLHQIEQISARMGRELRGNPDND